LFEIQPEIPYPDSYNIVVEQTKKEIWEGYQPALKSKYEQTVVEKEKELRRPEE
jgi:hypothetical protein